MTTATSNFAGKIQQLNSKNFNRPPKKQPRRHLAAQLQNATYGDRMDAMNGFLPEFKSFLQLAGITPQIQKQMGIQHVVTVDPRWHTSACDNVSARCKYLGGHFAIWSNGTNPDGSFELHLYGDLLSGKYRSGPCSDPVEFGRKFALLVCEAERIADLRWWHRIPERIERAAQVLLTFTMCVSFIFMPNNDWEKTDYFFAFFALAGCAILSYISRINPEDSLIDTGINQQAIAL
ncbi:MAG: hypothetical protein ACRC62_30065 [Microcoleus sp.]